MICQLRGTLLTIESDRAQVDPGFGLVYEVLLPSFAATRLATSTGQPLTLHTLQFIEATAQGATMFPRLAGFLSQRDLRFFELFVTCKGIGHKRALRAMVLDPATLAAAIADRDAKLIQTMPEVGKKLAETIVITLKDKVERFVSEAAYGAGAEGSRRPGVESRTPGGAGGPAREALEILLQLGEQRAQAVQWIDRLMLGEDPPTDAQTLVAAVYRLKAGS